MVAPRYVAKRVGEDYQLVRQDSAECAACYTYSLAGGALALMGLRRRTLPGLILAAIGGTLIYRGITGQSPLGFLETQTEEGRAGNLAPSYQHDLRRAEQLPVDDIEEASMESFPASDPPSHSKTTAG